MQPDVLVSSELLDGIKALLWAGFLLVLGLLLYEWTVFVTSQPAPMTRPEMCKLHQRPIETCRDQHDPPEASDG